MKKNENYKYQKLLRKHFLIDFAHTMIENHNNVVVISQIMNAVSTPEQETPLKWTPAPDDD